MSVFGIFHKNKRQISFRTHRKLFVAMFLFIVLGIAGAATVIFNVLAADDVPVPSVEISSQHSNFANNDTGSWKITKSAKWTGFGKARITFEVESVAKYDSPKSLDVLMVIDNSGSMSGDKMEQVITDAIDLTNSLLSDQNNRMALVTFNSSATVLSELTNNRLSIVNMIDNLDVGGATNYNQGLIKALEVLDGYEKQDDRGLVILFLTDGFPNEETMNEVAQYQTIKTLYPYAIVNGIQYEMGEDILEPIIRVSDNQYIANMDSLNNVLFDATIIPYIYDEFVITDYIDTAYWQLPENASSVIAKASAGVVTVDTTNQTVTWDMSGKYLSGVVQTMTIDIELNATTLATINNNLGEAALLPTNTHETITSEIKDTPDEDVYGELTPVLKSSYDVIYDANTPSGCEPTGVVPATTAHTVFTTVEISDNVLSCSGYIFKGWQIGTDGVSAINEDFFRMPGKDVYIGAIWAKPSISKSMDGEMHIRATAKFDIGRNVNVKLKKLSGQSSAVNSTENTTITAIERANTLSATVDTDNSAYIISAPDSMLPIYAWYDEGVIYYYTETEEIYLNADARYMFRNMRALASITGANEWITKNTTDMSSMFDATGYSASSFELDLSNWDTSNVTNMYRMFYSAGYSATNWTVGNLSNWDTSKVTSMRQMFFEAGYSASAFDISCVSGWDTSSVTNMGGMFMYAGHSATSFELDLSNWNTSKVTDMSMMFSVAGHSATSFRLDLANWNTSSVTDMNDMFSNAGYSATSFELDLANWDTSSVTNMGGIFSFAGYSATSFELDLANWDTSKVTDMTSMFYYAGYKATTWSVGDLSNWDTSKVTSMEWMFREAGYSATSFELDLSNWDTSNVTNMSYMFHYMGYRATSWSIGDLSGWDTSKVLRMSYMFQCAGYWATIWSIGDLSGWDTSNVIGMDYMFAGAGYKATTWSAGNLSSWNVSKVTDVSYMFSSAGYSATSFVLDLSSWNTSKVTSTRGMFSEAGHNATTWSVGNLSSWNTSNVTDMNNMFAQAGYSASTFDIGHVSSWNVSSVTDMTQMFYYAGYSATTWSVGDLSGWNTSSATSMQLMFYNAGYSATSFELDLSNWDTSKVTNMSGMLRNAGYSATTWSVGDLSGWNTSNVTKMSSLFNQAGHSSTTWSVGDLSNWDTSKVTNMNSMFYAAGYNASTFDVSYVSNWNTSKVTSMDSMFRSAGYRATTWSIGDLSNWDTSNVTNMQMMFYYAGYKASVFELDLSSWNTSKVTVMSDVFYYAGSNATTWSVIIPQTNGNGIANTTDRMYGSTTSRYATPLSGRSFTLATS